MNLDELICHNCGFSNETKVLFCRNCGARLQEGPEEPEKQFILEEKPAKATGISCARIGLALFGIFILLMSFGLLIPNLGHRPFRPQAREKSCYANMRVILGAFEMYNMDHVEMIDSINDADVTSENGFLVQGRYLKAPINRPEENCHYSGRDLNGKGRIECSEHGTVEGPDDR
jgi:competence protein ComGC